ncbi:protein L [Agrobacterium rubi]|uniref:protein L n=1 Tax=Agrobacterium rubi TaxID=28099 RepID=UPI001571ED7C|nr:protein L [Agrobacterium rubi]NTE87208.1 protein L [Agrobacterium rubi]NTF03142.1 protein L [Agrobacterium rubi]
MALYKDSALVTKATSGLDAFDKEYKPGETPPFAGIYRCKSCGDEIASNKGVQLPSQNHRQHSPGQGEIRWKLLVYAQQG